MSFKTIRPVFGAIIISVLMAATSFAAKDDKNATQSDETAAKQEKASAAKTSSTAPTTGEQINWQVISSGGTVGASVSYEFGGTLGQTAVGFGSSASYGLSQGFWQEFSGTCCNHDGIRGDVNYDDALNVQDLTFIVSYLFKGGDPPPCDLEGDVNGDGSINVQDLTHLVSYLFKGGSPPVACP